ncbi:MAG: hypothetical protein ANIMEMIM_00161 [Candidatus Argoarchaeum ethanivorans]|uniref:DUF11 domain-containing protein n=1 Tax=Candidatus Argoarchaeum ethanivorans TaxID=2608793 RepID=A0A811T5B0_9EURY|nr:MAG: hypothetical protein ANIMEMIM_00161 [Candidatus Argoarchaeum ethanivorans]
MTIRVILIVMLCMASIHATSASFDAEDPYYWDDVGDAALYKGDTYNVEGYTVEFVDYESVKFEGNFVLIQLRKGESILNESILNSSCNVSSTTTTVCDELIWNDEVKIEIYADTDEDPRSNSPINWPNPCIHINFYLRNKPDISLELATNTKTYTAQDSLIYLTATIENEGDAVIKNLSASINPGELRLIGGDLTRHWVSLLVDEEEEFYARLQVPPEITGSEGKSFLVFLNATGFDEKNLMHTESVSTEITVLPRFNLKIRKTVTNITMEQKSLVSIDVENEGGKNLSIRLNDTLPPCFNLCDNQSLTWEYNLTQGEMLHYSYFMKPTRPGIFEVPPATILFSVHGKTLNITSNACTVMVDGAYIIVNKTAQAEEVIQGQNVTVAVTVTNTGNKDAIIKLADVIPVNAFVINGNTTMQTTLSPGEIDTMVYTMTINSTTNIMLDSPEIAVVSSGYSSVTTSRMPVIEITGSDIKRIDNDKNSTIDTPQTVSTPPKQKLSKTIVYEILLAVSMLFVVYLIGRFR